MSARVSIVTAGHLSTCPRMLKAADALHQAGYGVRVVSANHTKWAAAADREVANARGWRWTVVDYSRDTAAARRLATGVRFKAAQSVSARIGAERVPVGIAVRAYSRVHDELARAAAAEPTDLVYGGTTGALAAAADAAATLGVPYALDLEDFHSGERPADEDPDTDALAERVEREVIGGARFVTAASPMIADAYSTKYRVRPVAIHNTFSVDFPIDQSDAAQLAPLRLYWFSQTIGPGRGLESVIHAAGHSGVAIELHLRGRAAHGYAVRLETLARQAAPALRLIFHAPAAPDGMVRLAQRYDAGLSCEESDVLNHRLCLGNKIFTYLAAGVPVILSATPAQRSLADDLGAAAIVYGQADTAGLGEELRRLALDRPRRRAARSAARDAARRRWHWEHPLDRGALLELVGDAVKCS